MIFSLLKYIMWCNMFSMFMAKVEQWMSLDKSRPHSTRSTFPGDIYWRTFSTGSYQNNVQSINHSSIVPISPAQQPNRSSTAKLKKQFCNINGPSGVLVFTGESPSQWDASRRFLKVVTEMAEWTDTGRLFQRDRRVKSSCACVGLDPRDQQTKSFDLGELNTSCLSRWLPLFGANVLPRCRKWNVRQVSSVVVSESWTVGSCWLSAVT